MSIFNLKPLAKKISFEVDSMTIETTDGRKLTVPLAFFTRLLNASTRQRLNVVISGGGQGLHWDALDEDISVNALFQGVVDRTQRAPAVTLKSSKNLKVA